LKILVVDDHALVREGLCQVLKGLDEQVQVLEAPHCARAFELAALHPDLDLVLLDYHLPDMNGLDALTIFGDKHPELPIVMLSGSVNLRIMRQVMAKGAAGFVTKAGDVYLPPELLTASGTPSTQDFSTENNAPLLTPRQEEVLYLLLDGRSNKDISQTLHLSEETTKNHVTAVLRCFGVQTRIQAVIAAGYHGYTKSAPLA
jgi:DNA-binding NarL/FixJ family response regulator